jgi:hexosaminidase
MPALLLAFATHICGSQQLPLLWPQPKHVTFPDSGAASTRPLASSFAIQTEPSASALLLQAAARYLGLVQNTTTPIGDIHGRAAANAVQPLQSLSIAVEDETAPLELGADESFVLNVSLTAPSASLRAPTAWGAMRGLETFSQLVGIAGHPVAGLGVWSGVEIQDEPRFSHREMLVDTARYFFDMASMLHIVDAMAFSKLNVLHWHIVDAQSFPLESDRFPLLAQKAAFKPRSYEGCFLDDACTYAKSDVAAVVAHARARGIRVIAEFDTPGHSKSWGVAYPNTTLAKCTSNADSVPLNPAQSFSYDLVTGVLDEMIAAGSGVFEDAFVHVGGDEVDVQCFGKDPAVAAYLAAHNLTAQGLVDEWAARVHGHVAGSLQRRAIVWEESLTMCENNASVLLGDNSVVQVWKGPGPLLHAAQLGLDSIYSYGWYVDKQSTFAGFYDNDPFAQGAWDDAKRSHVIGGGVSKWGCSGVCLTPDGANKFDGKVWVPAMAVAERLWSDVGPNNKSDDSTVARARAHRERLLDRGVAVGRFK